MIKNITLITPLKSYSILLLFVFFISCNQPNEKSIEEESIPVDKTELFDYWEHSFISYSTVGEVKSNELYGYNYKVERGRQWVFRKDTVFITEYPVRLIGKLYFEIKQDSIIFPNIHFFPRRNKVIFKGDTLILEGLSLSGTTLSTNYFLKSKYQKAELDFLIIQKVKWSLFTDKILKNANQKKIEDTLVPYIPYLDLRKSNSENFYTNKDTLFYKDSIGSHLFKFRDDMMNSLGLYYLNDTLTKRVMFFNLD
jgi:hypothetical protein